MISESTSARSAITVTPDHGEERPADTAPVGRPRTSTSTVAAVGIAVVALLTVLRVVLAWRITTPAVIADEPGYLFQARYLAHVGVTPSMGIAQYYAPFYSALLAPLAGITSSHPLAYYRLAQLLNVAVLAGGFFLFFVLGTRVFAMERRPALGAAAVASAYPAYMLQAGYAWPESLLPVMFTAFVLALYRLEERPSTGAGMTVAVITVTMYATHQRAILLPLVAIVAVAVLAWRGRISRRGALVVATATVALAVACRIVMAHLEHTLWVDAPGQETATLHALVSPAQLVDTVWAMAGMAWYLAAASFGLAALGVYHLVQRARAETARFTAATTLAACGAVLFVSATAMRDPERSDHLVYGRYVEVFVGVLLVAAVAAMSERGVRARVTLAIAAGMVLLGTCIALVKAAELTRLVFVSFNITGILAARALTSRGDPWNAGIHVLPITLIAVTVWVVLSTTARARLALALCVVAAIFLGSSFYVGDRYGARGVEPATHQHTFDAVERTLAGGSPIAFDTSNVVPMAFYAYQFWLPDLHLLLFDSTRQRPPTDLVLASKTWARAAALGARPAFYENDLDEALWVLPGPRMEALQAEGLLLPGPFPGPLPPAAYRSRIEVSRPDVAVRAGKAVEVPLRVTDAGRGAPWPQTRGVPDDTGGVDVVALWDVNGALVQGPGAAQLPRMLYPGGSAATTYRLRVPASDGVALPAGRYRVGFVPAQQGVTRFDTQGDAPSWITVDVTG